MHDRDDAVPLDPDGALRRLLDGNRRFVADAAEHPDQNAGRRHVLEGGQHPFASVFSCADSRVPPEILFDQGLGDLFVVRSAGQVLDHAILGTLEFGVAQLRTPLLVVVGHTGCGAVRATVDARAQGVPASGTHIDALVAAILPAVVEAGAEGEGVVPGADEDGGADRLVDAAVRRNVRRVVADVRRAPLVSTALDDGAVAVVGAVYHLDSGVVEVLDG